MAQGNVLVVEDEVAIRQLIELELSAAGFAVLHAGDGATALRLAQAERPDLFLIDFALPDMDGVDVITQVRAGSAAPIIVISGFADAAHKDVAMAAGATEYVIKPFDGEVLAELCRTLVSPPLD